MHPPPTDWSPDTLTEQRIDEVCLRDHSVALNFDNGWSIVANSGFILREPRKPARGPLTAPFSDLFLLSLPGRIVKKAPWDAEMNLKLELAGGDCCDLVNDRHYESTDICFEAKRWTV